MLRRGARNWVRRHGQQLYYARRSGVAFPPGGANVVGWLDMSDRHDVGATGFGIVDQINASNDAYQTNTSLQPSFSTSNGYDISVFDGSADYILWNKAGSMLNTSQCGLSMQFRVNSTSSFHVLFCGSGSGNGFLGLLTSGGITFRLEGTSGGSPTVQNYTVSYSWGTGWHYGYFGFDGTLADANRPVVWLDGAFRTGTPGSVSGVNAFPDTLTAHTLVSLAARPTGAFPIHADYGHVFMHGGPHLGATQLGNLEGYEPKA